MDVSGYTIKKLKEMFAQGPDGELVEACRQDGRKAAQQLVRAYEREQRERARVAALYQYEDAAYAQGFSLVAGVDEAGRGPLAGPVSVAAVILPHDCYIPHLNDSKKLSAKVRDELYDVIQEKAIAVSSVLVDAQTIDRVNIYQATINGMYEAIFGLEKEPQQVLIDAVELDNLPMPSLSVAERGISKAFTKAMTSLRNTFFVSSAETWNSALNCLYSSLSFSVKNRQSSGSLLFITTLLSLS